ncbi:hypothetical protein [Nonomuraea basaltis]|uniref:hypothetical protein n=1 Tax=Nonomuraea basaltis TaxID=2495887 RepID=UPI00110C5FB4|nr:hypothetical protein [Nonomuraea basaltis]TMR90526.1 hypothetical protein EJK15_54775 [Nonomuraea basaltis]
MVTRKRHRSRWPADVASFAAGVAAPGIVLVVADVVTLAMVLLMAVWMVVPLHAGGRVLADVRHGLACWSASRIGARHARDLVRRTSNKNLTERANPASLTGVTQGGIHHRAR